jgi:hypothetical protein
MGDPIATFGLEASDVPRWLNFVIVYDGTSELERRRGDRWYQHAWDQARAYAETHWHHGTQRRTIQAAAIVAALSQNTGWDRTLELATETFKAKGQLDGGTFEPVRDKCLRLFRGEEPYAVLGGPKITAFFACIAAQGNCADIVIDRHMAHMAYGQILEDRVRNQRLRQTKSRDGYGACANELAKACNYVNKRDSEHWTPAKFQAVLWVAWKDVLLGEERGFTAAELDRFAAYARS